MDLITYTMLLFSSSNIVAVTVQDARNSKCLRKAVFLIRLKAGRSAQAFRPKVTALGRQHHSSINSTFFYFEGTTLLGV